MLFLLAFILSVLTLCLIVMQVVYVLSYQTFMERGISAADVRNGKHNEQGLEPSRDEEDADDEVASFEPPAAIVLCLKGNEQNLVECLTGLVSQDYSNYQLFIVVDSEQDPALQAVANFFADRKFKPIMQTLRSPHKTCSLKCSAITQAIQSIPSRYEVIAFIDADAVPDQSWLSDLVEPLADSSVGATTGNRWYSPMTNSPGAWVRKIWNAAAVVQMQRYEVPWGGSLALRTETIERCGLVERWQHSFCEDTALIGQLKKQQLKLHRVPNLVLENTEDVSLIDAFGWISRQLLTVRLHHPKWSWVAAHALVSGMVAIGTPIAIILMLVTGQTRSMWTLVQAYVAWQLINSWLLWMVEQSNRNAMEARGSFNGLPTEDSPSAWMQVVGTVLTQWLYPFTAWQAAAVDKVAWRGVSYKVRGRGRVELIEKTDAAAALRGGNKGSAELLSTGGTQEVNEANGAQEILLSSSRFSKRSRN